MPGAQNSCTHRKQSKHPSFPHIVEDELILFCLDRTEPVHATHIVPAIYDSSPYGVEIFVTPIIESLVTISVSSSAVMFSVPLGLSGNMR